MAHVGNDGKVYWAPPEIICYFCGERPAPCKYLLGRQGMATLEAYCCFSCWCERTAHRRALEALAARYLAAGALSSIAFGG